MRQKATASWSVQVFKRGYAALGGYSLCGDLDTAVESREKTGLGRHENIIKIR